MKYLLVFALFFVVACSQGPVRKIASNSRPTSFEVDAQKSSAYLIKRKHFLIQVKNSLSQNIEINFNDVKVKNPQGKDIPFELERVGAGKYYVLPLSNQKELQISIQDKIIGKQFKVTLKKPVKQYSSISLVSQEDHRLSLRLKLADKSNRPLTTDELPEILIDGDVSIEDLKSLGNGVWEFTLNLPEHNVIVYLSVRSQEELLERLYRFQHVEK
jgi:hypothetical protein